MIQKTRRKLTFLYWGMSAVLFAAVLSVLVLMNYKKAQEAERYFFDNKADVIAQQIAFTRSPSGDFFRHMQENYGIYVYSETEARWYAGPSSEKEKTRLNRAASSLAARLEKSGSAIMSSLPFDLACTATDTLLISSYYGKRLEVETIRHTSDTIWILYDVGGKFLTPGELCVYAALALGGFLFLFVLCRFFVYSATKPVVRSIRQQNEFIASASHELKSPVAVIQLNAETIPTVDAQTASRLLETITDECRRLTGLIQSLLLLASGDVRRLAVNREELETDHFFIELYERYSPLCRQRGHAVSLSLDDGLPPSIRADRTLLIQVMGILIDNAVSYSLPGTPFALSVRPWRRALKVSLGNTAPPISREQQENLFNRFYQADPSRSSPAHSGLGLSIAKEIVEAHGGKIFLETCRDTEFVFSFWIPV